MNKAYKNFKSMLMVVDYHFEDDNNEKEITLDTKEKIEIKSIGDTSLLLLAERKLIFNGLTNTYLKVSYEVNISLAEKVNKEKVVSDIKKGLSILGAVYSDISLIIAQITDKSPFGAIISPPMYDEDEIEII